MKFTEALKRREDGGPAFAKAGYSGEDYHDGGHDGMSLRDYFAAAAMQGMLSGPMCNDVPEEEPISKITGTTYIGEDGFDINMHASDLAARAYEVADAMIAQRSKT